MNEIKLYDVVALLEDIPSHKLRRGQIGTVVEEHEPGVYEIEFSNNQGITYAMLVLRADQLMLLYSEPVQEKE